MGDKELLKEMGERIYLCRKNLKMTQEELAEKLGVSTQMISNLELGKKAIRPENLIKLCCVLDVSSDYILMGSSFELDSEYNDLCAKLRPLSKRELAVIENLLDYMNEKR